MNGLIQSKNIFLTLLIMVMLTACGQQSSKPAKVPVFSKAATQSESADSDNATDNSKAVLAVESMAADDEMDATLGEDSAPATSTQTGVVAEQSDEPTSEDVINNIIWDIQARESQKLAEPAPTIPEGLDPSLAEDALEAAFALLAKGSLTNEPIAGFALPDKDPTMRRVALLVPLSGNRRAFGEELRRGAEMALFSIGKKDIELLVFDTAGGPTAAAAAKLAVAADVDIIIGPLFTEAAVSARAIASQYNIPMLFLSNNTDIGQQGSWILGYAPEQQLDVALAHAINLGQQKFAVLAQNTPFGQRLKDHALNRLQQFGIMPEDVLTLTADMLNDEDLLKGAIKKFARYQPPEEGAEFTGDPEPPFDSVVFAGDAAFALRTAPVLAYYDVAADGVTYLGNAQWNQRQIHTEPSLQGGVYAIRPTTNDQTFKKKWGAVWNDHPGLLARLSFDAMAMVIMLAHKDEMDWQSRLISNAGFSGFSGAFRLLPDGGNVRAFELRQINNGATNLLMAAPAKI